MKENSNLQRPVNQHNTDIQPQVTRRAKTLTIFVLLGMVVVVGITGTSGYIIGKNTKEETEPIIIYDKKEDSTEEESEVTDTTDAENETEQNDTNEIESNTELSSNYIITIGNLFEQLRETTISTGDTIRNADRELNNSSCGGKTLRLYYDSYGGTHTKPGEIGGAAIVSYEIILQENDKNYLLYASTVYATQNSQIFDVYWSGDCSKVAIIGSFFDTHLPISTNDRYVVLYFDSSGNNKIKMIEVIEREMNIYELIDNITFDSTGLILNYNDGTERTIDMNSN